MQVAAAHTSQSCDNWPLLAVDELAPGNPLFSTQEKGYSARAVRLSGGLEFFNSSLVAVHNFLVRAIAVKCDIGLLTPFAAAPIKHSDVLSGGSATSPAPLDVVSIQSWVYTNSQGGNGGGVQGTSGIQPIDWTIKVARRLDADECLALLWFMDEIPPAVSLPSASSYTAHWNFTRSVLYSETPKK